MTFRNYKSRKHCRWCGTQYYAAQPVDRDGFHSTKCKQAHYRAYKKYVTSGPGYPEHAAAEVRRKK